MDGNMNIICIFKKTTNICWYLKDRCKGWAIISINKRINIPSASVTSTLQLFIFPSFSADILTRSVISELFDTLVLRWNVRSVYSPCVCVCVCVRECWLSFLTLMAAPLQDSASLERRNLSVSIVRKLHWETLTCFTVISQPSTLITARGWRVWTMAVGQQRNGLRL